MTRHLYCQDCRKYMGEIRDASLRKGLVVLCQACAIKPPTPSDVPDFLRSIMP